MIFHVFLQNVYGGGAGGKDLGDQAKKYSGGGSGKRHSGGGGAWKKKFRGDRQKNIFIYIYNISVMEPI